MGYVVRATFNDGTTHDQIVRDETAAGDILSQLRDDARMMRVERYTEGYPDADQRWTRDADTGDWNQDDLETAQPDAVPMDDLGAETALEPTPLTPSPVAPIPQAPVAPVDMSQPMQPASDPNDAERRNI